MRNEVLKNLENINEEDSKLLFELMENDIDVKQYLLDGYKKIMEQWKEEFPLFDIPSGVISICINGETTYTNVGEKHG